MPSPKKRAPPRAPATPPPAHLARPRYLLAVLSRKRTLYTTGRLLEAAADLGHRAVVLDTLRCNLVLERGRPSVFYNGHEVVRVRRVPEAEREGDGDHDRAPVAPGQAAQKLV